MITKKNAATYLVIALLFGLAGAYVARQKEVPPPSLTPAPALTTLTSPVQALFAQTLADAGGTQHALAQWQGKTLVINFWATWCTPCVEEMPELSKLQIENSKVQVIGIGIDSPANISAFANKLKIAYPVYVAGMSGTDLARQFGNSAGGLPYTVVIGADGQVKKTYLGRLKYQQLRADLAAL